ncbi:MAG: hypothetical protein ABSD80_13430 [Caulobacteraceae bacterium]
MGALRGSRHSPGQLGLDMRQLVRRLWNGRRTDGLMGMLGLRSLAGVGWLAAISMGWVAGAVGQTDAPQPPDQTNLRPITDRAARARESLNAITEDTDVEPKLKICAFRLTLGVDRVSRDGNDVINVNRMYLRMVDQSDRSMMLKYRNVVISRILNTEAVARDHLLKLDSDCSSFPGFHERSAEVIRLFDDTREQLTKLVNAPG